MTASSTPGLALWRDRQADPTSRAKPSLDPCRSNSSERPVRSEANR
jgi:hypothetical protein